MKPKSAENKFYRTTVTLEILSPDRPVKFTLEDIRNRSETSFGIKTQKHRKISSREMAKSLIRNGESPGKFRLKKNGEERKMLCTLDEKLIPVEHLPKPLAEGVEPRKRSEESLSVWDLNANGWRSFIYKNVLNCSFTIGDDQSDRVEGYESPPKFD
jgi:hypothetical protein